MIYAIFDLDGTITDSMGYWRNSGQYFLASKGFGHDEYLDTISDRNWVELTIKYFKEKYDMDVSGDEFRECMFENMATRYKEHVGFKPGAFELLKKLKAMGARVCLCSASQRFLLQPAFDRLGLNEYFDFILTCAEFGSDKHDRKIFDYCTEKLGAKDSSEVCVFEDALYSATTAKNAGYYVVGMFDETEYQKSEMESMVDQYVYDYAELDFDKLPK